MAEATNPVRIDKWLWAVRLFKTRALATEACAAGHVKVDGKPVKAARTLRVGDIVTCRCGGINRTAKVKGLIQRRIGAKFISDHVEDLTPPEEYERAREISSNSRPAMLNYPKGLGRPTKKQRRLMGEVDWLKG